MTKEMEIKAKITEKEVFSIKNKLKDIHPKIVNQLNIIFDFPGNFLYSNDKLLRLRKENKEVFLTFKGPKEPGKIKTREEYEVQLNSLETAYKILAELGLVPRLKIEKVRVSYRLKGATVVIDKVPLLGYFLEIEAGNEKRIYETAKKLGIDQARLTNKSYTNFISEYNASKGEQINEFVFKKGKSFRK